MENRNAMEYGGSVVDLNYIRFLIPCSSHVLEMGCGSGDLLAAIAPKSAIGIDRDHAAIELAKKKYPELTFLRADIENFAEFSHLLDWKGIDYVLLDRSLSFLVDIQSFLIELGKRVSAQCRIVFVNRSHYLEHFSSWFTQSSAQSSIGATALRVEDVENFCFLTGLDVVKHEWRVLLPNPGSKIGQLFNRVISTLPLVRKAGIRHYVVARSRVTKDSETVIPSVSIVIPAKNERGNIAKAISRLPSMGCKCEVIFVEGDSTDGTWEEILRVKEHYKNIPIVALKQMGSGKGAAVRTGFNQASGDILIILDADLTVPPEDLPKFVDILRSGRGEYVNGSRLVYKVEEGAMQFLNQIANHMFAILFRFLLNQQLTDTLCGTKAIRRVDYLRVAKNREYFGEFDPFGDFDLIFGAAKLNLKFVEIPIRYKSRSYGSTQIARFRHGWLLLRMVVFAYRKLKAI